MLQLRVQCGYMRIGLDGRSYSVIDLCNYNRKRMIRLQNPHRERHIKLAYLLSENTVSVYSMLYLIFLIVLCLIYIKIKVLLANRKHFMIVATSSSNINKHAFTFLPKSNSSACIIFLPFTLKKTYNEN